MNISEVMPNGNVRVIIPIQLRKTGRGKVIARTENMQSVQNQIPLLTAIIHDNQWQQYFDEGRFKSVQELAKHLGKERAVMSHTLQLAQLSPEIIHLALIGALPEHITLKSLKTGLPADWEEQKKFLRIE